MAVPAVSSLGVARRTSLNMLRTGEDDADDDVLVLQGVGVIDGSSGDKHGGPPKSAPEPEPPRSDGSGGTPGGRRSRRLSNASLDGVTLGEAEC